MVKESGNPDKETDYIGGIVYEDNVRKFISTEEGRIILESTPEYQYHMKDHLGNVRLTFSTKEQVSTYMATMESVPEVRALEEATFDNISNTQHQDQLYNITDSLVVPGAKMSARLNAADSKVMGPAMSLHVMAGDEVNMSVFAKYTSASNSSTPVTGMAAIVAASAGVGGVTEAAQVTAGLNDVLGAGQAAVFSDDNTIPKAYINYLFFDKNRQYKSGGFDQVSTAALNSFEELSLSFIPDEEGYMIIYVANQTNEDLNVYMDDMTIEHIEGPIIQTDDYYPFGLTFNSSERSGFLTNNFLYNGKELQTDLDLDWYDYGARMYDASIGRWHVVDPLVDSYMSLSPYNYTANNPIKYIDPDGKRIDFSEILRKEDDEYVYKEIAQAFLAFATSKNGIAFLSKFAEAGQSIGDHTFETSGDFHNKGVDLSYTTGKDMYNDFNNGETRVSENGDRLGIEVRINDKGGSNDEAKNYLNYEGHVEFFGKQYSKSEHDNLRNKYITDRAYVFIHESYLHAENYAKDFMGDNTINYSNLNQGAVSGANNSQKHHIDFRYRHGRDKNSTSFMTTGYNLLLQIHSQFKTGKTANQIKEQMLKFTD